MIVKRGGLMEDMISRQALCEYALNQKNKSVTPNDIMRFPSAQPEQLLSCKNCIHLGHGYMMPCKNCKRNQMLPDWYEV